MSAVSGATSKSPSSSGSHSSSPSSSSSNKSSQASSSNKSTQSSQSNKPAQSSSSTQSNASNHSSQSQGSKTKDTFESGSGTKKQVDIGGGQGSAQVSHDLKTGETKKSGNVDIAHVNASATKSTGPAFERHDQKEIAPNTTASNNVEAGKAQVGANLSTNVDDKSVKGSAGVHGEATAVKDDFHVKNKTTLVNGDKPVNSENTLDGQVNVGVKGDASADAYADKDGNAGAHVYVGGKAGVDGSITAGSQLSTVDDKGKKEDLAGGSVTLHGDAGVAAGFHAGGDFKDGKLSTDFGFNLTPGVGGGVDTKFNADFGNIAKEGGKIADEIGKGAGDAGYQAQKQIGETLSGIQKFLGGVHIFG
jgi:hypothetical protein